jgi:2-polyprenyl-3-methyl-5-hydroxy-6-metoxy-1,4-benzoquinol methylase
VLADLALDRSWLALLDELARAEDLALAPAKLAAAVRALSDAYNGGTFAAARSREALSARLLFSFPRDVPKMTCAARELPVTSTRDTLRVLDVGAGLGASTWGLARWAASRSAAKALDVTMIDDDGGALDLAKKIALARAREGSVDVRVTTITTNATRTRIAGTFDAILVGQALGEIDERDEGQVELLRGLLDAHLAPDGFLLVIEPALRDRTRRLHRVRDALAKSGVTIFAPCLHDAPCPMLANATEWCHEDLPIDLPDDTAKLARAAGLRWQGLTFSYLVLRKDGVTLRDRVPAGARRAVSLPIVTKGKREFFLCAQGALRRVARLDRDEEKGDAWSSATRGDVLAFEPVLEDDQKRVRRETAVRIAR